MATTFVDMAGLKIPKTIWWLIIIATSYLLLMTLYRLLSISLLQVKFGDLPFSKVVLLGLRFDCRYIALLCLPVFILGLLPGLHFFKRPAGKALALLFLTIATAALLLLYGLDFATQLSLGKRLYAGVFTDLIQQNANGKRLITETPWVIILLLAGVGTWVFYLFARGAHKMVGKLKTADNKTLRIFWQVLVIVFCVFFLYGSMGAAPLSAVATKGMNNAVAAAQALNPFESLLTATASK